VIIFFNCGEVSFLSREEFVWKKETIIGKLIRYIISLRAKYGDYIIAYKIYKKFHKDTSKIFDKSYFGVLIDCRFFKFQRSLHQITIGERD